MYKFMSWVDYYAVTYAQYSLIQQILLSITFCASPHHPNQQTCFCTLDSILSCRKQIEILPIHPPSHCAFASDVTNVNNEKTDK